MRMLLTMAISLGWFTLITLTLIVIGRLFHWDDITDDVFWFIGIAATIRVLIKYAEPLVKKGGTNE